jgi:MoaA/NifB/PqqE/SkfB family radical SAM enzyme
LLNSLRIPHFRALDFNAKYRVKRVQAYKLLHRKPIWTEHPSVMQFDRQNICNQKCIYCNPRGTFIKEHGQLPLETVEAVLKYVHDHHWFINRVSPFMSGEPLMDRLLSETMALIKKWTNARCSIYTNGTVTENRDVLLDANLDMINFTVSAATPETYRKVHGCDLFQEVTKNIDWFSKHRRMNQRIRIVFVLCKENFHELKDWKQMFKQFDQMIRPVHDADDVKPQSKLAEGDIQFTEFHNKSSRRIYPKDFRYELDAPCPAWDSLSISYRGEVMHCMDLPYELNYGKVGEVDIGEVWKKRLKTGLTTDGCNKCKMKNPCWKSIFHKYNLSLGND